MIETHAQKQHRTPLFFNTLQTRLVDTTGETSFAIKLAFGIFMFRKPQMGPP